MGGYFFSKLTAENDIVYINFIILQKRILVNSIFYFYKSI